MTRARAFALAAFVSARSAHADPSERSDRDRAWHVAPFAGVGVAYLVLELGLKEKISRAECWWCEPNRVDSGIRTAIKWDNVERADSISNGTGYAAAPMFAVGGLLASQGDGFDRRRAFDDVVPVLQAGIAGAVINQTFKVVFGRQRPFARFKGRSVQKRKGDLHTSFFSGHSTLSFAMASSAGTVATLRDYDSAPWLFAGGYAIAVATAYLRIAADAHYFTDVLVGAFVGSLVGIAIPIVFHGDVLTDEPAATPRAQMDRPVIFSFGSRF